MVMFPEVAESTKTDIGTAHGVEAGGFDPDRRVERGTVEDASPSHAFDPDRRVERPDGQDDGLEQANAWEAGKDVRDSTTLDGIQPAETQTEKVYTDDNGKIYRIGDELLPNNEYTINKYHYATDREGRVQSAEGPLRLTKRENKLAVKDTIEAVGKGFQNALDELGHLIGDRFDGGNGLENIVAMDRWVNRSIYKKLENRLAKALKEGHTVYYKVEPQYSGDSKRPDGFYVTDVVDGEVTETYIRNEGKSRDV